jgi:hypothetical protein
MVNPLTVARVHRRSVEILEYGIGVVRETSGKDLAVTSRPTSWLI